MLRQTINYASRPYLVSLVYVLLAIAGWGVLLYPSSAVQTLADTLFRITGWMFVTGGVLGATASAIRRVWLEVIALPLIIAGLSCYILPNLVLVPREPVRMALLGCLSALLVVLIVRLTDLWKLRARHDAE